MLSFDSFPEPWSLRLSVAQSWRIGKLTRKLTRRLQMPRDSVASFYRD
jgi:hypothetical protein